MDDLSKKVMALERLRNNLRADYGRLYNPAKVEIGDFTYGFPIVRSWGEDAKLRIGKFCSIGEHVQIYLGGNHRTDWITTYPFNVLLKDQYPGIDGECAATKGDIVIGNDVWIGNDVIILSGVTIGDGAVIGAGSVVTKDVQACDVVAGDPAVQKKILWQKVQAVGARWWDWPLEKIAEAIPILMSTNIYALNMTAVEVGE